MIARVLYRKSVQGVLNYVLGKAENTILGFQNTYSDTDTNMEFFGRYLTISGIGTIPKNDSYTLPSTFPVANI